ncbi:MAG: hypothetical protein NVS2B16_28240 [Chloroflexota bacterium]
MSGDGHAVDRVRSFLRPYGLDVHEVSEDTSTAILAAHALHTTVGSIVKSLLFLLDETPHLVLVCGDRKVDKRRLGQELNVRKVRLADPDRTLLVTGYAVGGVAPVASLNPVPALMDRELLAYPVVYAAAGSPNAIFPVRPQQLLEITQARLITSAE